MKNVRLPQRGFDKILIPVLLLIFIIASLLFLDIFPKVWMDEAWDSTTAYTFQLDGTFRNLALVSQSRGNQDVHFLQPRILSNIFIAPFFKVFGVGSVQGRLASVFVGALAMLGVYLLARKIGSFAFAFLCAFFFTFDNLIFVTTRTIRPEIFVVALGVWALYLVSDAGTAFLKLLFSGMLLGISLYAHPNAALVVVAIFVIALSRVNFRQYGKVLTPMIIGIVIGFLPYAGYVAYQDGANHFRDFWLQINQRADVITDTWTYLSRALLRELERYSSYIFFPYRLPIFLIQLTAIVYAFVNRRERFNQILLIFILVHVLLFPILISATNARYLAVIMPAVTILVIKMVWDMARWTYDATLSEIRFSLSRLRLSVVLPTAMALVLFVNQVGGDVWAVWQSRNCSFSPFIADVRGLVPAGSRVWGPMTFWFGFYDYPYRTEHTIYDYVEFYRYKPEYVIVEDFEIWGTQSGVTKRPDPFYEAMAPVREMLSQIVMNRGALVGSVPNSCYGSVEIYRLQW